MQNGNVNGNCKSLFLARKFAYVQKIQTLLFYLRLRFAVTDVGLTETVVVVADRLTPGRARRTVVRDAVDVREPLLIWVSHRLPNGNWSRSEDKCSVRSTFQNCRSL